MPVYRLSDDAEIIPPQGAQLYEWKQNGDKVHRATFTNCQWFRKSDRTMKYYKKCVHKGRDFEVRQENPDGTVTLIATDGYFAKDDGGWKRVDKFEWEKTVPASEVRFLDNDHGSQGDS